MRPIFPRPILPMAFVLCLVLHLDAAAGWAGTLYTVDRLDDVSFADACLAAAPADCSLRGAIRRANIDGLPNNVILLPAGRYDLTLEGGGEDAATTGDLDITSGDVTLQAAPGAHPEIRQLTGDRVFHVHPSAGAVRFEGPLTLQGGEAFNPGGSERGGSIYFFRADSLVLTDVHMRNAFAADSGGCLDWSTSSVQPGFLTMTDVSFTGCGTEDMGGAFTIQSGDSTVQLDRVTVRGNTSAEIGAGGTIFGGSATVVIQRSAFLDNVAASSFTNSTFGGGLFLGSGSFSIHESVFARNAAGKAGDQIAGGGGIFIQNSLLLLRNSTLSANRTLGQIARGSDLDSQGSTIGFEFSTLAAAPAEASRSVSLGVNTTLDVFASVVRGACIGGGTIDSEGLNIEEVPPGPGTTLCQLDHPGDQQVNFPLLRPLAGYGGPTPSHGILPAAEAFTFGVPSPECADTDQRGAPRLGLFCHSGAHEAGVPAPGPWIFADDFESGELGSWSSATP
ncbi:MAG: choice-of-anchor Q domain-containing protein [Acidobacteriota bacterium]